MEQIVFFIEKEISEDLFELPYRHIHHAESLRFMEQARCEYMKKIGWPLENFLNQSLFLVVTNVTVQYKREVIEGSYQVTVEEPKMLDAKRLRIKQRILNAKGKDAVVTEVEIMCIYVASCRDRFYM